MRPVPTYLLKRISDDIEAADRHLEAASNVTDAHRDDYIDEARGLLNEMRVYVNDAWEPVDLADARDS